MLLQVITRTFFSSFELFATLLAALSIFRFPLKYHAAKVAMISVILSLIAYFVFNNFSNFLVITNLLSQVILITIFFSIPILYSFLISLIGFLLLLTIEYGVILLGGYLNLTTVQSINDNYLHASGVYLATSLVLLLITYILQRNKLGFMFMNNWLTMKKALQKYNFILLAVIIISIVIIEIASMAYNKFSIHGLTFVGLWLLLLTGIVIAYRHNKNLLNQKYERLQNKSKKG